jgi:hypothetical protein
MQAPKNSFSGVHSRAFRECEYFDKMHQYRFNTMLEPYWRLQCSNAGVTRAMTCSPVRHAPHTVTFPNVEHNVDFIFSDNTKQHSV